MNKSFIFNPHSAEPELSLDEFELISDSLAAQMQNSLSKKPIAFLADKSIQHCLHLYAAFKAGNPFYHLNPATPFPKQIEVLRALNIENIFLDQKTLPLFEKLKKEIPAIKTVSYKHEKTVLFIPKKKQTDPCYFISTSGTTGEPKLIAINYEQLEISLLNIQSLVQLHPSDIFLHISQLCFDVAIADFFLPLKMKSSLLLISADHTLLGLEIAHKHRATVWSSSPSLFKYCEKFTPPKKLEQLKKIIHCGEAFEANLSHLWKQRAPEAELINLYGPAEATIAIAGFKSSNNESRLPIGNVFKDHMLKISTEGELLIKGPQVVSSYYSGGITLDCDGFYHTGDLIEESADGLLFYKGRIDQQIKIAGMRFNILEIEYYINASYPQMRSAVIFENEILYLIIEETAFIKADELKEKMTPFLPVQFIPKQILKIENLPINTSGKLDRKAIRDKLFSRK